MLSILGNPVLVNLQYDVKHIVTGSPLATIKCVVCFLILFFFFLTNHTSGTTCCLEPRQIIYHTHQKEVIIVQVLTWVDLLISLILYCTINAYLCQHILKYYYLLYYQKSGRSQCAHVLKVCMQVEVHVEAVQSVLCVR